VHFFQPDPAQNFNRSATDYFVNGRKDDIGAFDSPKHAGIPLGEVLRVGPTTSTCRSTPEAGALHNGDGLTWWDLQGELNGVPINVAKQLDPADPLRWRLWPNEAMAGLKDLRKAHALFRNRDMAWDRQLGSPSAERHIGVQPAAGRDRQRPAADHHRRRRPYGPGRPGAGAAARPQCGARRTGPARWPGQAGRNRLPRHRGRPGDEPTLVRALFSPEPAAPRRGGRSGG
jgi:hypothetical protein